MPEIAVKPLLLSDYLVDLAGSDYAAAVSSVAFTPSASTVTFRGGKPSSVFTDTIPATWTCALTYAQDWDTTGSLSQYLMENEGRTVAAKFRPRSSSGPTFTANVTITPGQIGGAVGTHATSTVTLGSDKPKRVTTA